MQDIPNIAAIERRAAQKMARQEEAQQIASKDRFIEDVERGFNPEASARQQARLGRFRTLESRRKAPGENAKKIQGVAKKAEEDLANSYSRRNPELPPDRLKSLRDKLHHTQNPEEILDDVLEIFDDPTLADEALEYLEQTTEGSLKESVNLARELLNIQKNREIIAGRNVDTVAKNYHKKGIGQNPTELRNLYRDITGNPREHNQLFSELSNQYPFSQLKMVIAFLLKGLAYDLKSKGPSIQNAELMRLMTEARNLQSILWVFLFFRSRMRLLRKLFSQYGRDFSEKLTFELLAREFIKLVEERYPSVLKLLKQTERLGVSEDIDKILILMQYRDAIRGLSPRLYKTVRRRQDLWLVIVQTLDELEEHEEED